MSKRVVYKTCTRCKKEYPSTPEYFTCNKNSKDGLSTYCKECKSDVDKNYYEKNKGELNKRRKLWRENNKDLKSYRDKMYSERMLARDFEDIDFPDTKLCNKCGKIKIANDFFINRRVKAGLSTYCKECTGVKNKKSYQKHKEKRKVSQKEYCIKNKDKVSQRKKEYYRKNKEHIRQYKKEWQQENKESIADRQKEYRQDHKKARREYEANRKRNDVSYRILGNLRSRLSQAFRHCKFSKSKSTKKLIGCDIGELKSHLQSLFLDGMSFDNYGQGYEKWSIDHIIPCASFDLTDPEQQKECFHYTNIQPLWNIDNWSKNSLCDGKYIRKIKEGNNG